MSNKAITWAYKQKLSDLPRPITIDPATGQPKAGSNVKAAKFVLVTLADMADSEHSCFPSIDQLSELTEIAPATVREHLNNLIHAGLLTREARRRKDGSRTSNRYYLDVDGALTAAQTQEPDSGASPQPDSGDGQEPESRHSQSQNLEGSKENPQVNPHSSTPVVPTLLDITPPTIDELFDRFWTIWPRKEAKKTARRAFDRALAAARTQLRSAGVPMTRAPSDEDAAAVIIDAAVWWANCWTQLERRTIDRIPHPSTWLNGERWTDERPTAAQFADRAPLTRTEQNLAVVARYAALEAAPTPEIER